MRRLTERIVRAIRLGIVAALLTTTGEHPGAQARVIEVRNDPTTTCPLIAPVNMTDDEVRQRLSETKVQLQRNAEAGLAENSVLLAQRIMLQQQLLQRQAQAALGTAHPEQDQRVLAASSATLLVQVAPQSINATGQISGRVVASDTNLVVAGVFAYAYTLAGSNAGNSPTDASGYYTLTGLATGSYYVQFYTPLSSPYLGQYYNGVRAYASATPVVVIDGTTTPNINAALERGGSLAGRVTAADTGLPLSSVYVSAYAAGDPFSSRSTSTDSAGYYTLTQLLPNTYRLEYEPSTFGLAAAYLGEFYNNKATLADAEGITVTAASPPGNYDAQLDRGATITGEVRGGDTGLGLSGVSVRALKRDATSTYDYVSSTTTDYSGNGKFTLVGIPSGSYVLFADQPSYYSTNAEYLPTFFSSARTIVSATPITVTVGTTETGKVIQMERGSVITGVVTAADSGMPLRDIDVDVYDPAYSRYNSFRSVRTDSAGKYTTVGLASGSYKLVFHPSSSSSSAAYLGEWFDDKTNYDTATLITLTQPITAANLNAVLARGGIITGQVTSAQSGAPLPNVRVTILDCRSRSVDSPQTDSRGVYSSVGLSPGYYRVYFSEGYQYSNTSTFAYIPEFFDDKSNSTNSTPVTVTAATTVTNISAALASGGAITGVIKAADTQLPLSGVQVSAYICTSGVCSQSSYGISDVEGRYRIGGLVSGEYYVYLDTRYYASQNTRRYYSGGNFARVPVTIGLTSVSDFALPLGGALTGRVSDGATGVGLTQTSVYVQNILGSYFSESFGTDAAGFYTATGMPTGNYRIQFQPYGSHAESYIQEYYNDKLTYDAAEAVAVTRGITTTNISAGLARGGQITGRITNVSGQPLQSVYVSVFDSGGNYRAYDYTDASGYYTTTGGLPNGNYNVRFELIYGTGTEEPTCPAPSLSAVAESAHAPETALGTGSGYAVEYYNDKATLPVADLVSINGITFTTGINAVLSSLSFDVRGQVLSGTVPLVSAYVYANNNRYGYTDANGYYTLTNMLTGTHIITASVSQVTFNPTNKTASVPGDATGVDFSGTYTTTVPTPVPTPTPAKRYVYLPFVRK